MRRAVIFFVHSELNYMPDLRWNQFYALMCAEQHHLPPSIPRISDAYQSAFCENKESYLNDPDNVPPALYLLARYRVAKLMDTFSQDSPNQDDLDSFHRLYCYTLDGYFFITHLIRDTLRFLASHLDNDLHSIAAGIVQDHIPLLRTLLKKIVDHFSQQRQLPLVTRITLRNSAALQHLIYKMSSDHLLALIHYFGDVTLKFDQHTMSLTRFILCETKLLKDLLINKDFAPLRALLKKYRSYAQTHNSEMTIDWSRGEHNIYLLAFQAGADSKFLTLMIDSGFSLGDLTKERLKAACEGNKTDTYYLLNAHVKFNQREQLPTAVKITLGLDGGSSLVNHSPDTSDSLDISDNEEDPYLVGEVFPLPLN